MTSDNLKTIKKLWSAFAAYYQQSLSDEQIRMYAEDCKEHEPETIGHAMQAWRRNPKHQRMPLPGQLLETISGGNARLNAASVVISLIGAIKRHGRYWNQQLNTKAYWSGSWAGDARAELGDTAFEMIERHGGWTEFVDSYENNLSNEGAFKAQLRDALEHAIDRRRTADILPHRPRLAEAEGEDTARLQSFVNLITDKGSA